jgi:hypothetical protein
MRERKLKKMFNSIYLHEQFEYDGFLIVPFLNPQQTSALLNIDATSNEEKNLKVLEILKPAFEELFFDCRVFYGEVKAMAGLKSNTNILSRGGTYIDESRFATVHVYCPLQKTNSSIKVFKASHLLLKGFRFTPSAFSSLFANITDFISTQLLQVNVQPGEALILHHALIHTPLNNENDIVLQLGIAPKGPELCLYKQHTENSKAQKFTFTTEPAYGLPFPPNENLKAGKIVNGAEQTISTSAFLQMAYPTVKKNWRTAVSEKIIEWLS